MSNVGSKGCILGFASLAPLAFLAPLCALAQDAEERAFRDGVSSCANAEQAGSCLAAPPRKEGASIKKLLKACEAHFAADRLLAGRGGTAMNCYEEALALNRGDAASAREHLGRMPGLNPEAPKAAERIGSLAQSERRREEAEARRPGRRFRDCDECPELVVVPAGAYMMGSPASEEGRSNAEGPVHQVRLAQPFAVGVYEVTRGEYSYFVSATGHSPGPSCFAYRDDEWKVRSGNNWRRPGFAQTERDPVVCVSWDDARAYVRWLSEETGESYRLLSESEWEYVARAGTTTARYWGEGDSGQCRYANGADRAAKRQYRDFSVVSCDDGSVHTAPVGSYEANGFGLYDVLGNVWEWTRDCWNDGYAGAPVDGGAWESGDCGRRVLRGGSWDFEPGYLRSAKRIGDITGFRNLDSGFRIARTLTP